MATHELTLLAIDDDPDNLMSLRAAIQDTLPQARVVTALNGPQGIALARAEDPDAILLDIALPGTDGYAVCRALKADDRLRHIPVLFLTARRADRASRIQALEAGAEAFLAKPLDEVELRAQIRAMTKIKAANQMQRLEQEQVAAQVAARTRKLEQELAERRRAEEELQASEERYHSLFNIMEEGLAINELVLDENGDAVDYIIVSVNPAFEKQSFLKAEQVIGRRATDLYQMSPAYIRDWWRNHREIQGAAHTDFYHELTKRWFHITTTQPEGKRFATIFMDITERKRAEEVTKNTLWFQQVLMNAVPAPIFYKDAACVYLGGNKAFERYVGLTPEQFIGKTVYDIAPGDLAERYDKADRALLNNPGVQTYEASVVYADGTRHDVVFNKAAFTNAEGKVAGLIGVILDITERKRAEEALRKSEERARVMLNAMPDLMFRLGRNGVFLDYKAETSDLYAQSVDTIIGKRNRDITPPEFGDLIEHYISATLTTGEMQIFEYQLLIPGRGLRAYEARMVASGADEVTAFVRDITERKLSEQRAFELALERERMAVLTKFIQDASHEFRTPLTIMQSNVYLLERLDDPVKRQRKLAQIGEQVTGITRLVELLVEMARLDGGVPFTTQPTDLNELIGAVAGKLQGAAAAKGLTLLLALTPDLPLVPADGNRLGRALHELMDNAVRFTPTGGSVTVRSASGAAGVTVEIQDSGPGIPPDVLPHIFERFYRLDVAHTTPGFGLGLPIARAIVERHGGRLAVESQEGAGSVFRIKLQA